MSNRLPYPIELYPKQHKFIHLLILIVMTVLLVGFMGIAQNTLITITMSFVLLGLALLILVPMIIHKPSIVLHNSGIELYYFMEHDKQFLWSEIKHIQLNKRNSRNAPFWQLEITLKQDFSEKITHPLTQLIYEDVLLNQREIFAIVEQSFHGKQPIYQQIDMSFITELKDKFSTPAKRRKTFKEMASSSLLFLVIGSIGFGKIAYNGINKEMISLQDGLTYEVVTLVKYPQIRTEIGDIVYFSPCRDIEERENYLCRKSLDRQEFIGNDVKFVKYYQDFEGRDRGIFLSGNFTSKADNKVHKLILTEEDISSIEHSFNVQIWFGRIWILISSLGLIISIIGIKRENSLED